MFWDKTVSMCVESTKYGVKELIELSYISLSFDFVNKPPSLECPKLNKPPGGLMEYL